MKLLEFGRISFNYNSQEVIPMSIVVHSPGLACSFFGVLFIFRQMLTTQGTEVS